MVKKLRYTTSKSEIILPDPIVIFGAVPNFAGVFNSDVKVTIKLEGNCNEEDNIRYRGAIYSNFPCFEHTITYQQDTLFERGILDEFLSSRELIPSSLHVEIDFSCYYIPEFHQKIINQETGVSVGVYDGFTLKIMNLYVTHINLITMT